MPNQGKQPMKKPKPELDRVTSILIGVMLHLKTIHKLEHVDLSEPIETLGNIVGHLEDGDKLK